MMPDAVSILWSLARFIPLWVMVLIPVLEITYPASSDAKTSVVSVSDPSFQSCKPYSGPGVKPILANRNLCAVVYEPPSSLKGHVEVHVIGPSTINERNEWINEVGNWLKTHGLDACEKTTYLTDPESVKPPLAKQVAGIPGEKAFYRVGGIDKPSFCR